MDGRFSFVQYFRKICYVHIFTVVLEILSSYLRCERKRGTQFDSNFFRRTFTIWYFFCFFKQAEFQHLVKEFMSHIKELEFHVLSFYIRLRTHIKSLKLYKLVHTFMSASVASGKPWRHPILSSLAILTGSSSFSSQMAGRT